MHLNFERKLLGYGVFISTLAVLTFAMAQMSFDDITNVFAQLQQNQTSVPHHAKGYESHQVIIFQNPTEKVIYSGMVTFNLLKPADVIAFEDITGKDNTNAFKKVWEVGDKKFVPTTLLKNVTEGSVSFNGSGILAHSTMSDAYTGNYTLNTTTTTNNSTTNSSSS